MSFQEYSESLMGKLHLGELNKRVILGIVILLGISAIAICFGITSQTSSFDNQSIIISTESQEGEVGESLKQAAEEEICVHVGGCVSCPGLVMLKADARVADAVAAAGGFSDGAATDAINLARAVEDGEQVIIPSLEQLSAPEQQGASQPAQSASASRTNAGKVNLNSASSAELQSLSGIGASKAQKIIAYRESNGLFDSIEELTKVSGIGEKTLDAIRDMICV